MRKRLRNLFAAMLFVVFLWWLVTFFQWVPPYIIPLPDVVAIRLSEGFTEDGFRAHVFYTLSTVVLGLLLGTCFGFIVGAACGLSRRLNAFLLPVVVGFQSVPLVAFAPLLLLLFGQSFFSRTVVVAIVVCFPILAATAKGFSTEAKLLTRLFLSIGATKSQTWFKLRFPLALPYITTGFKTAVPMAWVGALVAEFLGTNVGLGFVLQSSGAVFDTPMVFAVILLLSVFGIFSFLAVEILEETILKPYRFEP